MQIKSKKGGILDENIIGVILAAVAVFLLVYLMINLFTPSFDRGDEIAESYFDSLKDSIESVDSAGGGNFFMFDYNDEKLEFYLVYFDGAVSFRNDEEREFVRSGRGDSLICVCYWQGDRTLCNHCMNLDLPVSYSGDAPWTIEEGKIMEISKDGGSYVFVEK